MWTRISIPQKEIHLATVLACGQSFRWRCLENVWSIGIENVVLFLKQDHENIYWRTHPETKDAEKLVRDYLNLKVDLPALLEDWKSRDNKVDYRLDGVRILRQDPWETLCAFICSSNNNIKRISKMVHSLCSEFGPKIATLDGQDYHAFPSPQDMLDPDMEEKLRDLGFGYRARYIAATALQVADKPPGYLESLRSVEYPQAKEALLEFTGVGPKVADCVCLMALDKNDCVPVDTHIWQIAKRDYKLNFQQNAKGYATVQSYFRDLWGEYAGWAQAVVFAQDLREFKGEVATKVQDDIKHEPKIELSTVDVKIEDTTNGCEFNTEIVKDESVSVHDSPEPQEDTTESKRRRI